MLGGVWWQGRVSGVWGGWQGVGKRAVTKGAGSLPYRAASCCGLSHPKKLHPLPPLSGAYHVPSSGSNSGPFL